MKIAVSITIALGNFKLSKLKKYSFHEKILNVPDIVLNTDILQEPTDI